MPKWSLVTSLVLAETQNPGGNCEDKNIIRKYLKRLQIQQGIADQRKDENRS